MNAAIRGGFSALFAEWTTDGSARTLAQLNIMPQSPGPLDGAEQSSLPGGAVEPLRDDESI